MHYFSYNQALNSIFPSPFFLFLALIVPNTLNNMPRGFTILGLFFSTHGLFLGCVTDWHSLIGIH